jgi:hypothetical protein
MVAEDLLTPEPQDLLDPMEQQVVMEFYTTEAEVLARVVMEALVA